MVTGANSGIGKSVAITLAQAGADVVVNYKAGDDQAKAVVEEAAKSGGKVYAHQADVSKEDEVHAMFEAHDEHLWHHRHSGELNAGLQMDSKFEDMTLKQWQTVIDVNLTGQFLCSREAVREFKRRGVVPEVSCAAGKIIHISSVHEVIPWARHAELYRIQRAALCC